VEGERQKVGKLLRGRYEVLRSWRYAHQGNSRHDGGIDGN
jgi:hypothetical protein